ncbi:MULTISPECIES: CAP domain-containing protein [Maribacter]|uniref:CAP domain-containing protein n=1 Tax=Maribacter flavus TaxID=1658664 RepID=A0ABU7IFC4_9FLAO|nr:MULTISPECIES: CAP domain-containing protein [Maribacter]MDC6404391.1 CAP domain-containing protein [Maribacter sp. PR66]MEE1971533.1 CAP domain-containing protein [Maribacter flavus]
MRSLLAIPVLFVLLFSCTAEPLQDDTIIEEAENNVILEQEVLAVVNEHRASLGLNQLEFSEIAYKYANKHTDYMISKGSLSHDNFSARASSINSEITVKMVAENVAKEYDTAMEAFEGWYQSSSHKKTMEGEFSHTAVSVKRNAQGEYYYTQLFYQE